MIQLHKCAIISFFADVQGGEDEDPKAEAAFGDKWAAEAGGASPTELERSLNKPLATSPVTSSHIPITRNNGSFCLKTFILAYFSL